MTANAIACAQRLALAAVGLLLGACSQQELYSRLGERQANDMVSALRGACIDAGKEVREGGLFAITVPSDSFTKAADVLRVNGLPRDDYDSVTTMFPSGGIVPSAVGERARYMHALSQDIARTLSNIDGVVVARVHLSLPEKDPLADKLPPAAASVFVKHRAGIDLNGHMARIKAMLVNSIQGLAYDNVTVVFFQAEPERRPATAPACRAADTRWAWAAGGGIALLAVAALGWFGLQRPRSAAWLRPRRSA